MAYIRQFFKDAGKTVRLYPATLAKAVKTESGGSVQDFIDNAAVYGTYLFTKTGCIGSTSGSQYECKAFTLSSGVNMSAGVAGKGVKIPQKGNYLVMYWAECTNAYNTSDQINTLVSALRGSEIITLNAHINNSPATAAKGAFKNFGIWTSYLNEGDYIYCDDTLISGSTSYTHTLTQNLKIIKI